jgi:tRNA(Ile)-lysidine synthase
MALVVLAAAAGCAVRAWHVDHQQRPGSDADAKAVGELARALGAEFEAVRVDVEPGANLEARLREARYAALPSGVLTGHTADDRAETVLLNLVRGAGPTGWAGIERGPTKPLLDLRRHETEALCAAMGLEPCRDPSNDDPRFRRNRIRHELLPLWRDIGARDPVPLLVRQADLAAEVARALGDAAGSIDPTCATELAAAPSAVASEAIRRWLRASGVGGGYSVDSASVQRVLAVARGAAVATEVVGGWRVARRAGRLSVQGPGSWQDADHG